MQCVNAVVIHDVALMKKQNSLIVYLQMIRIKSVVLLDIFILF